MGDHDLDQIDESILACEVPDEELEVAAGLAPSLTAVASAPFTYVSGFCC
jgi:hypothetical protein